MHVSQRPRRPRGWAGYLLLEAVIAGGVVSIGLSIAITLISGSRVETSMAARRAEASAYAMTLADAQMSTSVLSNQAMGPVPGHPLLRASVAVTNAPTGDSVPPLPAGSLQRIVVVVEYPSTQGVQTIQYERLRRRVLP